jgi:TolB-like protein/DNA-binding winged helix-turn-helix (wHTH) protein/tetratricopeptide (TPR) repeat protein
MLDSREEHLGRENHLVGTLENSGIWRFGIFEVDVRNLELRRNGVSVRLREQSFRILVYLLEHAGDLVTREDLRRMLWPADTFVDFDHSLNTAMMKLRDALGDVADSPVYIETIPKRGYRFVAPVVSVSPVVPAAPVAPVLPAPAVPAPPVKIEAGPKPPVVVARRPATPDNEYSIAVLPFRFSGTLPEAATLAEVFTEEFVAGFLRFSYLRVIARSLTQRFAADGLDVRSLRNDLGARYALVGNIRQAGENLRITVRLVDVFSGANLWSETYEPSFRPETLFDSQDTLVPRIVSTIADGRGILPRTISEALRAKDIERMTPNEAVLRAFAHFQRLSAQEHAACREALERAVQLAPNQADCWAMLSLIYKEEFAHGFNLRPNPLGRAFSAAHRAVEADPSNHLSYHALAAALYFRKEIPAFRAAADRAIALNPMDGFTIAYLGFLIAYSGEWDLGCALAERARDLNPHHPGWYWFAHVLNAYRKHDYAGAVEIGIRIHMPQFWRTNVALAAAYGQLGDLENAQRYLYALQTARPSFAVNAREELSKWWDTTLVNHLLDGLCKAGLQAASDSESEPATLAPYLVPPVASAPQPPPDAPAVPDPELLPPPPRRRSFISIAALGTLLLALVALIAFLLIRSLH